jgi:hypothetical protein
MDPSQPLNPGRVDEILFRLFPRESGVRDGEPGVLINGIGNERLAAVDSRKICFFGNHGFFLQEIYRKIKGSFGDDDT